MYIEDFITTQNSALVTVGVVMDSKNDMIDIHCLSPVAY